MTRTESNQSDASASNGSCRNPKKQLKNKSWDGVERRSGKDRRTIAYLQGKNRRKGKDRRRNSNR